MTARLTLRPADAGDCERLLAWANSPDCLANKRLTQGPIAPETHRQWLDRRLADPGTLLLIAEDDGVPVGQVRLQQRDGAYDVDIYVTEPARQRGVAVAAIDGAARRLGAREPQARLRAHVGADNAASARLFAALGFRATAVVDGFAVFERPVRRDIPA